MAGRTSALLVSIAFLAAACGGQSPSPSAAAPPTSSSTPTTSAPPGDPAEVEATNPPTRTLDGFTAYAYKTTPERTLYIHVIEGKGAGREPLPAVVFFHGGGWLTGNVLAFEPQARRLAELGVTVLLPEYRIQNIDGTFVTEASLDGRSAIRWTRANAAALQIDPDRIAAGGGSAGGHLAAQTANDLAADDPGDDLAISTEPAALILFNPAVTVGDDPAVWPGRAVDDAMPPTVIFHGTADAIVPIGLSREYCDAIVANGGECALFEYQGASHGFFNEGNRDDTGLYAVTIREVEQCLSDLGWTMPVED